MPHDLRTELEDTPEGRIAAAAFAILDETVVRYGKTGHGPRFPDRADFREGLQLYVRREIVIAKLQVIKDHGTFPAAIKLQMELDQVNWEIAKRESE